MLKKRLIPVLILNEGAIVQSVGFRLTNVIHSRPIIAVDFFNRWAVDEMIVLDVSRTRDKRNKFYEVISGLSRKCFVPLTVGGWVDSLEEARKLLRLGADKICINTAAVRRPDFITECAAVLGSQCIVVSIDSKCNADKKDEVHIDRGREPSGLDPVVWSCKVQGKGAGEIILNSIDHDGLRHGYCLDLLHRITQSVTIPVIAMGGVFTWDHMVEGILKGGADAVAAANIFHYTEHSTKKAKEHMRQAGIDVR